MNAEGRIFLHKLEETKIFSNNNNILFTMSDKGNATVALNNELYIMKMNQLLHDQNTYIELRKNPLINLQKRCKDIMNYWNDNGYLDRKYHKNALTQTDTSLPKIYGLPKIHKNNIPLRPIVSCIGSPTYKLSKRINSILKQCLKMSQSYIKDSIELREKIKNVVIPDDYIMISLDVISLFTNTPYELIRNSIEKRQDIIFKQFNLPLHDMLEAAQFLIDNTYFQFNKKFYQQIHGTPMGSPCSPIFADMVMIDLEEECIKKLSFKPLIYFRYVDDILTIIPKNKLSEVMEVFNSYHTKLQFTHECEINNSLNFLEVKLIKYNNKLLTDWYHKDTFSGRILDYKSQHPYAQKRAMIFSMVDKVMLLSEKQFHHKNFKLVTNILQDNNYPLHIINSNIHSRIQTKYINKDTFSASNSLNAQRLATLSIPYIPRLFENISQKMKKYNIRTVPKITSSLNRYVRRGKDSTQKMDQSGVVYKINCKDCDATYVGETKRKLSTRINEHYKNSLKDDKEFVINDHMNKLNHTFNFNNVEILDRDNNWRTRTISEVVHINLQKSPINIKEDINKLQTVYSTFLHKIKK